MNKEKIFKRLSILKKLGCFNAPLSPSLGLLMRILWPLYFTVHCYYCAKTGTFFTEISVVWPYRSLRTDVPKNICVRKFKFWPFIRYNIRHKRCQVVYIYSNASLPFYLYIRPLENHRTASTFSLYAIDSYMFSETCSNN